MAKTRVRLLWANGNTSILADIDAGVTEIQYQGPSGPTSFCATGEANSDGIDTYTEVGCSWIRVHSNGSIAPTTCPLIIVALAIL